MSTPHNEAGIKDIAKTVIMPGDPLRAKYIADKYLTKVKQFNKVRNMLGYTGYYKDKRVSVMAHGMGCPSMGIYSYELYKDYDVDTIIRVGTAGAYVDNLKILDTVIVESVFSESNYAYEQCKEESKLMYPDAYTNASLVSAASIMDIELKKVRVRCIDSFYHDEINNKFQTYVDEHDCDCVDMESFALIHNANIFKKKAAVLLTIVDSFITKEEISTDARESSLDNMIVIALESVE
ncbi:MAG: purine-nucleoside phosphorylase [Erysipelotrichaceae bacterium]